MEFLEDTSYQQDDTVFLECLRWRTERNAKKRLGEEIKRTRGAKLEQQALDAAFDGELQLLRSLLDAGLGRECQNIHGDTLLSEAAVGGQLAVVQFLLGIGARPNSHGRYRRSPLWRASFNGHLHVARALLRSGGDPGDPDEAGALPIDVCANPDLRAVLACWHMPLQNNLDDFGKTSTQVDNIAKNEQSDPTICTSKDSLEMEMREERRLQRKQLQRIDLEESIAEAEKLCDIASAEVIRHAACINKLESQHDACTTQAAADEMKALDKSSRAFLDTNEARAMHTFAVAQQHACRAEAMHHEAAQIAKELEWQVKRSYIKRKDWESAEAWRQQVAQGCSSGLRAQVVLQCKEDWLNLISNLSPELDSIVELLSSDGVPLKPGDCLICEDPPLKGCLSKEVLTKIKVETWPWSVWFTYGFDASVNFMDLGNGLRHPSPKLRNIWPSDDEVFFREDGRWPLFIDPTNATSSFFKYSTISAHVFNILELTESSDIHEGSMRLRLALLKAMLYGIILVIDFGSTGFSLTSAERVFDHMEKGLFGKLMSRGSVFTYLLPRHFISLIPSHLTREYPLEAFTDDNLTSFVLAFNTSLRDPDAEFSRLFFKVRVCT